MLNKILQRLVQNKNLAVPENHGASSVSSIPSESTTLLALQNNSLYNRRKLMNRVMLTLSSISVLIGISFLLWIVCILLIKGLPALTPMIFNKNIPAAGDPGGGLANAITGSLLMVFWATAISAPVGLMAGTYLAEYGKNSWLTRIIRFINDILLSAPSIVVGMFIYLFAYYGLGMHRNVYSGWAGSLALAIIMLPVMVRSTDDMLKLVPNGLREAAIALGCPYWKMIVKIGYRSVRAGILTGLLLGVARIFGETAPLLFTAFGNQFWNTNMSNKMESLPNVIYKFGTSAYERWNELAWTGALLITLLVLLINILTRWYANKANKI